MYQNSLYKPLYKEFQESDPTQPGYELVPAGTDSLTIHWENGEEVTFYYPFLMSIRLFLPAAHNLLVLRFTSEKLSLKGYNLKLLRKLLARKLMPDIHVCNLHHSMCETIKQPLVIEALLEERKL